MAPVRGESDGKWIIECADARLGRFLRLLARHEYLLSTY